MPSQNPRMSIALSSGMFLCGRYECGDFDLDLGALIGQTRDVEQCRGREISSQRLAPGCADPGARGLIFAPAGQVPSQADDVPGTGAGLRQQFYNSSQRRADLTGHVGLIVALLV